jgi:hypothetical protein
MMMLLLNPSACCCPHPETPERTLPKAAAVRSGCWRPLLLLLLVPAAAGRSNPTLMHPLLVLLVGVSLQHFVRCIAVPSQGVWC